MMRKKADVRELKDVVACRVVVPKIEDCYKVLKVVNSSFITIPEKFKNYILKPKKTNQVFCIANDSIIAYQKS